MAKKRATKTIWYAAYRGDEFLVVGTADECAEFLGVTKASIQWQTSPTGRRKSKSRKNQDNALLIIKLDE